MCIPLKLLILAKRIKHTIGSSFDSSTCDSICSAYGPHKQHTSSFPLYLVISKTQKICRRHQNSVKTISAEINTKLIPSITQTKVYSLPVFTSFQLTDSYFSKIYHLAHNICLSNIINSNNYKVLHTK